MEKKYILTDRTKEVDGHILHRIQAIKDFSNVHNGDLGGWIESEDNLSQEGDCWVRDEAMVYENATVQHSAQVYDHAKVYGNADIRGNARIHGHAEIFGNAMVFGQARIQDRAKVCDQAIVCDLAIVTGHAEICEDAIVKCNLDYMDFHNNWSNDRYFTWTRSNNMWKDGCFYGTGEELIKRAYVYSEKTGKCYETIVKAQELIAKLNNY